MKISIRKEKNEDYVDVYAINTAAFEQENEAKLVDLLRNSNAFIPGLSLVATVDRRIVGHILFTKIDIIAEDGQAYTSLALAPMAVVPDCQKQGIGGELIQSGLDKARALGYRSVIVLGHEKYYPKFGFVPADQWRIKPPFDVPANVFMAIELVPDGLKNISGTVRYAKPFEKV